MLHENIGLVKRIIKTKNTVPSKFQCLADEEKRLKLRNRMSKLLIRNDNKSQVNKSQESLENIKNEDFQKNMKELSTVQS